MTSTAAPFGMLPVRKVGGKAYTGALGHYNIQNGTTGSMFLGDPVRLRSGYIIPCTVAGGALDVCIGVFMGCRYNDPVSKRPVWSPYYPTGTSSHGLIDGRPNPIAMIADDPDTIFKVQANASVTVGDIGLNFLVSVSVGSSVAQTNAVGLSRAHLEAASRVSTAAFVKMVGLYQMPGNSFSNDNTADTNPIVEVVINAHQLRTALTSTA